MDILKKVEMVLNEGSELDRYFSIEYKDYKYGDPQKAAKELKKALKKIDDILSGEVASALHDAGSALMPGMNSAFKSELQKFIKSRL